MECCSGTTLCNKGYYNDWYYGKGKWQQLRWFIDNSFIFIETSGKSIVAVYILPLFKKKKNY